MGAWGSGSFENDTALDWAGTVRSLADVRSPFEQLKALTDASPEGGAHFLDADLASELIAAGETVAMLMGRKIADFPNELQNVLANEGAPDDLLFHQARNAVCHVLRHSELAELWEEAAADSGVNEWNASITGLIDRLNPDIEFDPPKIEDIEQAVGAPVANCAFCDAPIERDSLFGINLYDASNAYGKSRGFWLHLPCLNALMHHKYAILDLKFDPDNLPDLNKL